MEDLTYFLSCGRFPANRMAYNRGPSPRAESALALQEAFAAGVSHVSAAGNSGGQSYESDYLAGVTYSVGALSSVSGAENFAGGVAHDFAPGAGLDDRQGFLAGLAFARVIKVVEVSPASPRCQAP